MKKDDAAMELNKDNLSDYLRRRTDVFADGPIAVDDLSAEETHSENDGFINFVYRASQNGKSYIIKQARPYLKSRLALNIPVERNYLEYVSFILREGIAGGYVPKTYFVDTDNNVFMMEDISRHSRNMRFQLSEGTEFANLPYQLGTFLARNHFYTSELYLQKQVFREMQYKFFNADMRAVMEDMVLIKQDLGEGAQLPLRCMGERMWKNPAIRLAILQIRDNFIKKSECLVHGDFHTSNLFVNRQDLYVIDMEYSFMAPFSYDLGYLLGNFISQYAAFTFHTKFPREKRVAFQNYLLHTIEETLLSYFTRFREYFEKDAKPLYRETAGYLDGLFADILQEALGVMATVNMSRIVSLAPFPDFDSLKNEQNSILAKGLSLAIDEYLLLKRGEAATVRAAIEGIKKVRKDFLNTFDKQHIFL